MKKITIKIDTEFIPAVALLKICSRHGRRKNKAYLIQAGRTT